MPTETFTTNERLVPEAVPKTVRTRDDDAIRELALRHLEHIRKFKLYAAAYVLGLLILTPVWVLVEYMSADGWPQRLSDQGNVGDWDPWILWVALVGAFIVGVAALRAYVGQPVTEAEIEREVERLKSAS